MLKLIGKILVILLVVALFTAGIYALVQNTSVGAAGGFGERGFEGGRLRPPNQNGAPAVAGQQFQGSRPPEGFGERDGGGEGGFSFFRGMAGVLGHSLEIGLITLLVLFIRRLRSERKAAKQPAA